MYAVRSILINVTRVPLEHDATTTASRIPPNGYPTTAIVPVEADFFLKEINVSELQTVADGLCYNTAQTASDKETRMPRFIIERNFAEQIEVNRDVITAVIQVNADVGVQWLFSFLSADKKKTYCLYEAPNAEAIREAARRLHIPADVIIEVDSEVRPEASLR